LESFAKEHGLKIHPERNFASWGDLVTALGRCPCKVDRLCPCEQVLEEIKSIGHCFCKFFMSEKYFLEFTERLEIKKGRRVNNVS